MARRCALRCGLRAAVPGRCAVDPLPDRAQRSPSHRYRPRTRQRRDRTRSCRRSARPMRGARPRDSGARRHPARARARPACRLRRRDEIDESPRFARARRPRNRTLPARCRSTACCCAERSSSGSELLPVDTAPASRSVTIDKPRSLVRADGEQRAARVEVLRLGRRLAVLVDDPAFGHLLPLVDARPSACLRRPSTW